MFTLDFLRTPQRLLLNLSKNVYWSETYIKMADKSQILRLYKELLRESGNFKSYYYKNYFTRKVRSQFREHLEADEDSSIKLLKKSEDMLAMLKRQTMITNAFGESRLVIEENSPPQTKTNQESELSNK